MVVSGRHMAGGERARYEGGTRSGGQVCGRERWMGSGRWDGQRREIEWGTSVEGCEGGNWSTRTGGGGGGGGEGGKRF
jgi:hypothetical protein